tara:strand:+ start:918 stop:1469 length:552 start_codon:yes stop_codon:yes gene_type:complete
MWYSPSHGLIKTPRSITKDGLQHPAQIFRKWSKEELANIGFHPVRLSVPDHRYYNTSGEEYNFDNATSEWVISYGASEKNVADLKVQMKVKVKSIASSTLSASDWMTHRESDGGAAMPEDWKTYRADVRAMSNTKEAEIDALADLDAVKLYNNTPGTPNEQGGIPIIDNVTAGWPNDPDYVAS